MPRKSLLHRGIASFSLFNCQLTRRFVVASPSETVSGKNDSFCFPTNSERFSFIASSVASAAAWTRQAPSPNNNLPREHTGDVVNDVILPRASIYASTRKNLGQEVANPAHTYCIGESRIYHVEHLELRHLPNEEISECSSRFAKSGNERLGGLFIIYAEDKIPTCMVIKWIDGLYTITVYFWYFSKSPRFPIHQTEGTNWIWIALAINILIIPARSPRESLYGRRVLTDYTLFCFGH
jgi:hypothetical protein